MIRFLASCLRKEKISDLQYKDSLFPFYEEGYVCHIAIFEDRRRGTKRLQTIAAESICWLTFQGYPRIVSFLC
jgi:hypothetical protein